jgi:hypothetical protein
VAAPFVGNGRYQEEAPAAFVVWGYFQDDGLADIVVDDAQGENVRVQFAEYFDGR